MACIIVFLGTYIFKISWLQPQSPVVLETKKIKSVTVSTFSGCILLWSDITRCHDLGFWMLSFKPDFSVSPHTLIKKLFSSSSLSTICCCYCSVAQSCPTLCDPTDGSTPGFPVLHYLIELPQTHVHRVDDAIQPPHLLSPSPPALNLSQHQGLSQWDSSLHEVTTVFDQYFPWGDQSTGSPVPMNEF